MFGTSSLTCGLGCPASASSRGAAGAELRHVVKPTAFMADMDRAKEAWAVREEFFAAHPPASTGVEVSRLTHPDFLIEIAAIAVLD